VNDSVAIIRAGRLGQPMARTALRTGGHVAIADSRGPESPASLVRELGDCVSAGTGGASRLAILDKLRFLLISCGKGPRSI